MMSKEFLKHLGILGITVGLTASPLVMAQQTQQDPAGQQESGQAFDSEQGTEAAPAREAAPGVDPGDPAAPGIDPASPEDPGMQGTEADSDGPWTDESPAREAAPGVDPGDPAAPGIDPASPGVETSPGNETQTSPQTEAAPGAAMPDDHPAGAEGEAGFGEGAEPVPGSDAEQDEWEQDDY
ncbi:hypothetical protein [Billgrantia montanilacus]|uniref:Uncharacterized protein n=1 Tax=Billgrantia montanilacus TaxID=2282305 RepID=A0A368TUS6_9GAMM|nr:hypothetical protein [Halomonas montanilacus]RCV88444.1 hypothetical protein DU505_14265 [Halomonas montanilacus]